MSSTSTVASDVTSSASASPSPSQNNNNNNNVQSQPAFYRNLFYILIGLLAVFAIVSVFSLYRTRRRRSLIRREAERLGVLVPGLPGYIPLRERQSTRWTHADGTISPDWWDVGAMRWMKSWARPAMSRGYSGYSTPTSKGTSGLGFSSIQPSSFNEKPKSGHEELVDLSSSDRSASFHPLAIIPPQATAITIEPIHSTVKQFPNHLAYRPSDLLPPPSIWDNPNSSKLEALGGEHVDVVTMIRMPEPEQTRTAREEEGEEDGMEVLREWGGVCLGVMRVDVAGQAGTGRLSEEDRKGTSRGKGREI